jgi:hypothetical protein
VHPALLTDGKCVADKPEHAGIGLVAREFQVILQWHEVTVRWPNMVIDGSLLSVRLTRTLQTSLSTSYRNQRFTAMRSWHGKLRTRAARPAPLVTSLAGWISLEKASRQELVGTMAGYRQVRPGTGKAGQDGAPDIDSDERFGCHKSVTNPIWNFICRPSG